VGQDSRCTCTSIQKEHLLTHDGELYHNIVNQSVPRQPLGALDNWGGGAAGATHTSLTEEGAAAEWTREPQRQHGGWVGGWGGGHYAIAMQSVWPWVLQKRERE